MPMMTRAFSLYLVISGSSLEGLILRRNGSTFVNNSGDDNHDDNDSNDDDNDDNITLSLYFSYFWLLGTLSSMR